MAKRTVERDEPPSTKKRPKRDCHFDKAWIQEFQGIGVSSKGVLQPDKAASFSVDTVIGLAKRFPQPDLADSASLDQLREEFIDFTLSPSDLPTPGEYHAADGTIKPRTGIFWSEVGLLTIPISNADAERGLTHVQLLFTWNLSPLRSSKLSFEYLLLPPRSAPEATSPGLYSKKNTHLSAIPIQPEVTPMGLLLLWVPPSVTAPTCPHKLVSSIDADDECFGLLLQICGSFCKLVYLARTTPPSLSHDSLQFFDEEASIHKGAAALAAEARKHAPMMQDAKHSDSPASSCRGNIWKLGKRGTMCFFSLGYSAVSKTRSTQVFSCQGYLWLPQHLTGEVCG
eukprot:Em0003g367a